MLEEGMAHGRRTVEAMARPGARMRHTRDGREPSPLDVPGERCPVTVLGRPASPAPATPEG